MNPYHSLRPFLRPLTSGPALTLLLLIAAVFVAACNIPTGRPQQASEFSDKNARMYQMYFDSSADPALNELQIRRFMGHLHMADLAEIFGDISALPLGQACNHGAGPVIEEGTAWYVTATPDLVGVNLVSLTPDGTRSSAFDLDGDRVIDILDIYLPDHRRYTFFTEQLGLDVIQRWSEGLDPFCDPELIRQLGLPELGCNETGDGSSDGGGGIGQDSGLFDPLGELCSEFYTGPGSGWLARNPNRAGYVQRSSVHQWMNGVSVTQESESHFDSEGNFMYTDRMTSYINPSTETTVIVVEVVTANGEGLRITTTYHSDGRVQEQQQNFTVKPEDRGKANYDSNDTSPPPPHPAPSSGGQDSTDQGTQGGASSGSEDDETWIDEGNDGPNQGNPGPEGGDVGLEEMCRDRANFRSGIEQAVSQNPAAINVSCGDLVGAPGGCTIIQWASPADFSGVLEPPAADEGCDQFDESESGCEGASVEDRIRRILGRGATMWSLDLPALDICPMIVCNPADSIELQAYTAGDINIACPAVVEAPTPTLEPSEENCPPGTYYAPVTNRCIQIQVPGNGSDGGSGGDGGGNSCQPPPGGCAANEYWSEATCTCQIFG